MSVVHEAPNTHIRSEVVVQRTGLRLVRMALPEGQALPPHHADADVALIVTQGRGRITVGARSFTVGSGSVIAVDPGQLHAIYADTALDVVVVQAPPRALEAPPEGPWSPRITAGASSGEQSAASLLQLQFTPGA